MSNFKKTILLILACAFMTAITPADKAYAGCGTREQALEWVYAQEGRSLDYDGYYGAQCVDLINYYYQHLGVPVVYGNAYTFASNRLPEGWTRIQNTSTFVPQPGDIAVWGTSVGGGFGHVAIILSANQSSFVSMDQNWGGRYCRQVSHNYNGFWGVIRPNFDESGSNSSTKAEISPKGVLDEAEGGAGRVRVKGWAFDEDDYNKALVVQIWTGDASGPKTVVANITADKERTDVGRAYPSAGSRHGFDEWVNVNETGRTYIYAYAVNIGDSGSNTRLGYKAVDVTKAAVSPKGTLDAAEGGTGRVRVKGWAFDEDDYSKALEIQIWTGDASGAKTVVAVITADKERTDVGRAYPSAGSRHGFDDWINVNEAGRIYIYAYAVNIGSSGSNTRLGYKAVDVTKGDTAKPVIQDIKVTDVTSKGYTVSCTVTDDTAVDRVQFPTWTAKDGQDDLLQNWQTSSKASGTKRSGNTYSYYVSIADHNNETGTYCTHIYAYDTSGNCASVSVKPNTTVLAKTVYYGDVNKDGKITSADASLVTKAASGRKSLSADQKKRADVNGDGKVNSKDARLILQYVTGKINAFPVEA